ncbi:uncharacterized protein LOC144597713 [Rhinoraja longicauda]
MYDNFSLEDALGPEPPSGSTNPQLGQSGPQPGQPGQPGPWPGQPGQPGPWPGQPGQPGQPGPWPGQPGQPGPWPGQPGQPGPWPGQPGQPGQPGPWPGQPGQPGPWPGQPGQPGQPGPWPGQPGQPGPWPGQPWQQGPLPGQPGPQPGQPGPPGSTTKALTVPYDFPIRGWPPNKVLTIEATIKTNVNLFAINVCTGHDIAFHFNVRFKEEGNHQAIVRNCCVNNVWGPEERDIPHFPFKKGEKFELLILGEPNQYKVAVNKQHFIQFKHRSKNLGQVTNVNVYGDIMLHKMVMM